MGDLILSLFSIGLQGGTVLFLGVRLTSEVFCMSIIGEHTVGEF